MSPYVNLNRQQTTVISYELSVNSINRVNGLSQEQSKNNSLKTALKNRQQRTDNRQQTTENREQKTENGYQLSVIRKYY
ncbi:hypothetical protein [Flavobacterium segetis]|uniref:hypothetical protein n=1 Tax=Flavobacterium segetis TaxID=271157 RepID=UPI001160A466|nr:hypothetical protein [Flavobacterium segetis]